MKYKWPNFDVVILEFQKFLYSQQWPKKIRWIPVGGVLYWRGNMFVRVKNKETSESEARIVYNSGVKRNFGVALNGLCHTSNTTWAYVSSPINKDASERLMYGTFGPKMSLSTKPIEAIFVQKSLKWFLLNWVSKKWGEALGNKDN